MLFPAPLNGEKEWDTEKWGTGMKQTKRKKRVWKSVEMFVISAEPHLFLVSPGKKDRITKDLWSFHDVGKTE